MRSAFPGSDLRVKGPFEKGFMIRELVANGLGGGIIMESCSKRNVDMGIGHPSGIFVDHQPLGIAWSPHSPEKAT